MGWRESGIQERADGVDGEPNSVTALGVGPDLGDDLAFAHRPAEKDAGTPQSSATPTKPSKHWVWSVMELTEEQLYERIGLDGVMFLRLVDIGWQTCTFLALFVGIPLLIVYSTIDVSSRLPFPPLIPPLHRASRPLCLARVSLREAGVGELL
jgi:hypothetical protein